MQTINRHEFPPQGWQFMQAQTRWKNPYAMVSFEQSVNAIVDHRRANPDISRRFQLTTDWSVVAHELESYTRLRLGIPLSESSPLDPGPKTSAPPFPRGGAVVTADGGNQTSAPPSWFGRLSTGIKTLGEWLGDKGIPVPDAQAVTRADRCVDCPQNKPGDLLSFFTKPAARLIQRQVEERQLLKLSTPSDPQLGVCDACGCPLKLKVHVPLEYILKHQPVGVERRLDARCWILAEKGSSP